MPSDKKISEFIVRLTKATVDKMIKWNFFDPPRSITLGTESIISTFLLTKHNDQRIAIYERRYTDFDPDTESHYWTSEFVLAIIAGDTVLWDYKDAPAALDDLFRVARDSAADIDKIIDSFSE